MNNKNILELERYYKAAEEAALELLAENAEKGLPVDNDVVRVSQINLMPLTSPGRIHALQQVHNNAAFR